jgi:hypothetical protein
VALSHLTFKYSLALLCFFFSADGQDYALQTISKGQRLLDLFRARKCAKKNWALDMEKSCAFVKEDLNKKRIYMIPSTSHTAGEDNNVKIIVAFNEKNLKEDNAEKSLRNYLLQDSEATV